MDMDMKGIKSTMMRLLASMAIAIAITTTAAAQTGNLRFVVATQCGSNIFICSAPTKTDDGSGSIYVVASVPSSRTHYRMFFSSSKDAKKFVKEYSYITKNIQYVEMVTFSQADHMSREVADLFRSLDSTVLDGAEYGDDGYAIRNVIVNGFRW